MQAQKKGPHFWWEKEKHLLLNIKDLDISMCKYCNADLFKKVAERMKVVSLFTSLHSLEYAQLAFSGEIGGISISHVNCLETNCLFTIRAKSRIFCARLCNQWVLLLPLNLLVYNFSFHLNHKCPKTSTAGSSDKTFGTDFFKSNFICLGF